VAWTLTRWDLATEPERERLAAIPFGGDCFYCKTPLPTEADHARHFRLADRVSTHRGYCPNTQKRF
jgi:hypothetical protein